MADFTRRDLLKFAVLASAVSVVPRAAALTKAARVVVVGGGFGGVTAARFLKQLAPDLSVTLVEPNDRYIACPFSNLVVAGLRGIEKQTFAYGSVASAGISVVKDIATQVNPERKVVVTKQGIELPYDRLVLSPGIEFRWGALDGYSQGAEHNMPHAWKAGSQTLQLRDQLKAMPEDGLVVMSVPAAPFRCPPGPYERASLIANFLKREKPKAKLVMLDSNGKFSKQPLFEKLWQDKYPGIIDRQDPGDDGVVRRVDPAAMTVFMDFDSIKADVVNIIPPQKAGQIAQVAGVADASGWCPINGTTFESTLIPDIHVIGDATIAVPMPKSAFSANVQGKVCAVQIVRSLAGLEPEPTTLLNTCYSFVDETSAISVSGVYHNKDGAFTSVTGAGGISPLDAGQAFRISEGRHARDWFNALTQEAFG